jgi:hypothetical protein
MDKCVKPLEERNMASLSQTKEYNLDLDDEEKRVDISSPNTTSSSSPIEPNLRLKLKATDAPPRTDDFTVKWEENDPLDPRNRYTNVRKWLITWVITTSGVCVYV